MKPLATLTLLTALCGSAAAQLTAERKPWSEWTFDKAATHLAFHGDDLWVGTIGGGVYRWETGPSTTLDLYRKFTRVNDGLADNFVYDMAIEPGGTVWVATDSGISYFQGNVWKTYDSSNSPLAEDLITAVAIDAAGDKWIGTYSAGLYHFDGSSWVHYSTSNSGLSDNFVTSLEFDSAGALWAGVWSAGVDRFSGGTWTNFHPGNSGLISYFAYVKAAHATNGEVWIWCYDDDQDPDVGMLRFDGQSTWTLFRTYNSGILSDYIHSVAIDQQDHVWFQGSNGLSEYDGASWTTHGGIYSAFDYNFPRGSSIALRADGQMWIGTASGIAQSTDQGFLPRATPELWDNRVEETAHTSDGAAWIAGRSGLQRLRNKQWTRYTSATSPLPGDDVRALAADASDRIWAGTTQGLARLDGAAWTVYTTANSGIHSNKVLAVADAPNGDIWVGSGIYGGGVSRLSGGQWTHFTSSSGGLASNSVFAIDVDAWSGAVWFGTGSGVSRYIGGQWTTYTTADGLAHNFVHDLVLRGSVAWVATHGGVTRISGGFLQSWTSSSGLREDQVNAVGLDASGNVWIGYPNAGVSRNGIGFTWKHYDSTDGLTHDRVISIDGDASGRVWFGTDYNLGVVQSGQL